MPDGVVDKAPIDIDSPGAPALAPEPAPISGHAPVEPGPRPQAPEDRVSLRDFLTTGSVPALVDELARLTATPIWLRDSNGEAIIPGRGHPWQFVPEETAARRAAELVGWSYDPGWDLHLVPLTISTGDLGALVTPATDAPGTPPSPDRAPLHRAMALLAASVAEICESQTLLRQRIDELDALYRLSGLLVQAGDVDRLLTVALDLAIDALRADAGSIALIEEDRDQLTIKGSRALSPAWLALSARLNTGGPLRTAALAGEVVTVEDMLHDERIADPDRVRAEGLCSLMSTGLIYKAQPIGLIRLYARRPHRFSHAQRELLRAIAEHSAAAVANARLGRLRAEDERIQRQVRMAGDVQRQMLPRSMPAIRPLDVAAHCWPSFELSGDFYDFVELGGHLGVVIADVVGKGVPAALLMAAVRASLRAHAQDVYDIGEVLSRVNAALVRDTRDNEFATLWYGVIDPSTLRLTYCGAGHEWPLLFHVPPAPGSGGGGTGAGAPGAGGAVGRAISDADVKRLTADGMALGIDPRQKYAKGICDLKPRDVVVAYTDGLTDATDFSGRHFGGTRVRRCVLDLLAREPEASAARIVEHVLATLRQFSGLARRTDDVTLVVVRVGEGVGPGPVVRA